MTVTSTNVTSGPYIANGVTTTFPFTFQAASVDEIGVLLNGLPVDPSQFTVDLNGDGTGSVVFFVAPLGSLEPYSNPDFTQAVNFEDQGPFYQSSVNEPIDRAAIRDLYLKGRLDRAPVLPFSGNYSGMFPVVNVDGSWGFSFGTGGGDAALRSDLSNPLTGSTLVAQRNLAGATRSVGLFLNAQPLMAANYGVVGDGITDDTAAAQAFLNLCQTLGKTANFGALRVKISGPLTATNVNVVFDQWGYGPQAPGFYVTGSGYTALTVLGAVSDFCVSVYGSGTFTVDGSGNLTTDTRPQVNGIAFGTIAQGPLLASIVRSARAYQLSGFGVSHYSWDTTFHAISVEQCGNVANYAWQLTGDASHTCNECNFVRVQVELSCFHSSLISPYTLSCTFGKIHSERAYGRLNDSTWQWGPGVYQSVRMSSVNGMGKATVLAQSGSFYGMRAEGINVEVSSNGGAVDFYSCEGGTFVPAASSNGRVNFHGGSIGNVTTTNDWNFYSVLVTGIATISYTPAGTSCYFNGCTINVLQPSSPNSYAIVRGGVVNALVGGSATWGQLSLLDKANVALSGGTQSFGYCKLWVGENVIITGNLTLDNVGCRFNGRLLGNFTANNLQTLWGAAAEVTGTMTNAGGPPASGLYLDGFIAGMWSKNMRPVAAGAAGSMYVVFAWTFDGAAWQPLRAATGS